jgi:hypothetical protein
MEEGHNNEKGSATLLSYCLMVLLGDSNELQNAGSQRFTA